MVSLSVTRLVVSGGTSATGRRCDVVSVTDLRSIANISLLMLDIDLSDLAYHRCDQPFCRWACCHAAGAGLSGNGLHGPVVSTDGPAAGRHGRPGARVARGEEHFG